METQHNVLQAHLQAWLDAKGDRKKRGELTNTLSKATKLYPKSIGKRGQPQFSHREEVGVKQVCDTLGGIGTLFSANPAKQRRLAGFVSETVGASAPRKRPRSQFCVS